MVRTRPHPLDGRVNNDDVKIRNPRFRLSDFAEASSIKQHESSIQNLVSRGQSTAPWIGSTVDNFVMLVY